MTTTKRKFSTPYNYDRKAVSQAAAISFHEPSLTKESEAESTDINVIFRKFGLGLPVPGPLHMPTWGADFTNAPQDFMEAQNIIREARESFDLLPSDVREKFNNDPLTMLTFVSDDANIEQARLWGLVPKQVDIDKTEGLGDGDAVE